MSIQTPFSAASAPPAEPSRKLAPGAGLSRGMVTLFAFAAGLAVANIYYAQPLLTAIANTFHVGPGAASGVVTATTVGYAAGLCLLVPLGDMMDRRKLLIILLLLTAASLALCAAAPSFAVLIAASVLLSLAAVSGPVLVPFAATLAAPEARGRVTGTVMSGVLIGVLLSRTAGGLIAQLGGWRAVFWTAAVLTVLLAALLARMLPRMAPASEIRYGEALGSVLGMLRREPSLRMRSAYGFFGFATFSVFWTAAAFLLTHPPYRFNEAAIGLFALVGASGATAARITGRLTDRGWDHAATGAMLLLILGGWALMGFVGGTRLAALIVGVIVLDFGVQGAHVTNFGVIYRLPPHTRSRVTTAYLTSVFIGGVAGSAAAGAAYAANGWHGVCVAGAAFGAAALLLWLGESLARRRGSGRNAPEPDSVRI